MSTSNWINLGLLALTAIGLLVTLTQAFSARKARKDAKLANESAAKHERAALDTSERSAAASEDAANEYKRLADYVGRQTALAEERALPREPWIFEPLGDDRSDQKWRVTNATGDNVLWVSIGTPEGSGERWIEPDEEIWEDVERGATIEFTFVRRLTSPTSRTIWVIWAPPDGSEQVKYLHTIP